MTKRTVLRGGWIVTLDAGLGDFECGDLLIEDGRIAAVAPALSVDDAAEIDVSGRIVLPGFIDTHRHTWQTCVRHRCVDRTPAEYFTEMLYQRGGQYTPDDVYIGTLLGALGALEGGITTLLDWSHVQNSPEHSDAAIQALKDSGMRAVFGHGWPLVDPASWMNDSERPHPHDIERLRREHFSSDDGLLTLAMAARGPEMASTEVWRADLQLARSLGIRSTIHMGAFGFNGEKRAIAEMQAAGMLGDDLTFVHCNCSHDDEIKMMADFGVTASLGINIEMNSSGIGDIPLDRLLAAGVKPSLSGDTEACGCGDMFTQMRGALAYYRFWMGGGHSKSANAPSTIQARDVLSYATVEGARANGMLRKTGSLSVGKVADIITINSDDLNLLPVSDPAAAVVAGAHPGNVDLVMVEGRILKENGALKGFDLPSIRDRANQSHQRILERGL